MDQTERFLTDLERMSPEEVRGNFLDLFHQALGIEVSEWQPGESHEPGSASRLDLAFEL